MSSSLSVGRERIRGKLRYDTQKRAEAAAAVAAKAGSTTRIMSEQPASSGVYSFVPELHNILVCMEHKTLKFSPSLP
jgi:hypothetical protein